MFRERLSGQGSVEGQRDGQVQRVRLGPDPVPGPGSAPGSASRAGFSSSAMARFSVWGSGQTQYQVHVQHQVQRPGQGSVPALRPGSAPGASATSEAQRLGLGPHPVPGPGSAPGSAIRAGFSSSATAGFSIWIQVGFSNVGSGVRLGSHSR